MRKDYEKQEKTLILAALARSRQEKEFNLHVWIEKEKKKLWQQWRAESQQQRKRLKEELFGREGETLTFAIRNHLGSLQQEDETLFLVPLEFYHQVLKEKVAVTQQWIQTFPEVSFVPDVANPSSCLAEADGWLEIGANVEVFYDPHHPKRRPVVGSKPFLLLGVALMFFGFLIYSSLLFLGMLAVLAP